MTSSPMKCVALVVEVEVELMLVMPAMSQTQVTFPTAWSIYPPVNLWWVVTQKWTASEGLSNLKTKGVDKQAGQDWRWEMKVEKAMGQDLYRYQAQSGSVNSKNYQATLAVYLVEN